MRVIDHKSAVLARYPRAIARDLNDWMAYHHWVIEPEPDSLFVIGGGPTEADAWHNAFVHIDTAERWKARREREDER